MLCFGVWRGSKRRVWGMRLEGKIEEKISNFLKKCFLIMIKEYLRLI